MTILRPSSDLITGGWTSPPGIVTSKQVWRQQPQVPASLDRSAGLGKYLQSANLHLNTKLVDCIGGRGAITVTSPIVMEAGGGGIGTRGDKTTGYLERTVSIDDPFPLIMLCSFSPKTQDSNNKTLYMLGGSANNAYVVFGNGWGGSSPIQGQMRRKSDGNIQTFDTSKYSLSKPVWNIAIQVKSIVSSENYGYINGQRFIWSGSNHDSTGSALTREVVHAWHRDSTPTYFNDDIIHFTGYGAGASIPTSDMSQMLKEWTLNPWQIFQKKSTTTYFLPPLYDTLNETTYDDTDYISTSTAGDIARVSLGTYTTSAGTHTLKYRAASPEADRGLIAQVLELGQPPAIILKRDVWRSQPQTSIEIAHNNQWAKGLVGYWPFNPAMGAARDLTKYNNTATLVNVPTFPASSIGRSLSLNGSTQYANCGKPSVLALTTSHTLSAWVYLNSSFASGYQSIVGKWSDAGGGGTRRYVLAFSGTSVLNGLVIFVNDLLGNVKYTVSATPLSSFVGKWVHVVGVTNIVDATQQIYINGVLDNSGASKATSLDTLETCDVYIGNHTSNTAYLNGSVCNVGIHNRAVTASEVKQNYGDTWQIFKKQPKPIFIDAPKVIASHTKTYTELGTTPAEQTLTLSAGEVASITNGAELALEIEST